jgi:hypothetical protein
MARTCRWGRQGRRFKSAHPDMNKIGLRIVRQVQEMRRSGLSHRQISRICHISVGTVFNYARTMELSSDQHLVLKRANLKASLSKLGVVEREIASRKGGLNTSSHFKTKHTRERLLSYLKAFVSTHGRIPYKSEVSYERAVRREFGSWNTAMKRAGFTPNPVKFSYRYKANDGHMCDSLAEKIIDDLLSEQNIPHERRVRYIGTRLTADFKIGDTLVEYFGLKGRMIKYDRIIRLKRLLARRDNLKLVALYPWDLLPTSRVSRAFRKLALYISQ